MTSVAPSASRRLVARLAGGEIDPPLRPVLAVAFLQAIVEGAQTSFLGLWALRVLGASSAELGVAFALTAAAAVASGYLAGRYSDRHGRRLPILVASAALPVLGTSLGFVSGHVLLGFALMMGLGASGGALLAVQQTLVSDLVPPERREHAFASARVIQNVGLVGGPLIGALLLTVSWRSLFVATGAIAAIAFVVAVRVIPRGSGGQTTEASHESSSFLRLARDPSFTLVLAAGTLAAMVYVSYETLLPISLVQSHGLAPSTWGVLLAINPIAVVLFQIRLSAKVGRSRELTRLAIGVSAMGLPFLLVSVSTAIPLLVLMLLLFVLGEMLWVPPSQALIARLAPEDMRGAYIGAGTATLTAAFALGPLIGLQIRSALGDTAMWIAVAAFAGVAIVLYGLAERLAGRRARNPERAAPPII